MPKHSKLVPMGQQCERGLCENLANVQVGDKYICAKCIHGDQKREINMVTIHPHFCSKEEYGELIRYLDDNHWDYKIFKKEKGE